MSRILRRSGCTTSTTKRRTSLCSGQTQGAIPCALPVLLLRLLDGCTGLRLRLLLELVRSETVSERAAGFFLHQLSLSFL